MMMIINNFYFIMRPKRKNGKRLKLKRTAARRTGRKRVKNYQNGNMVNHVNKYVLEQTVGQITASSSVAFDCYASNEFNANQLMNLIFSNDTMAASYLGLYEFVALRYCKITFRPIPAPLGSENGSLYSVSTYDERKGGVSYSSMAHIMNTKYCKFRTGMAKNTGRIDTAGFCKRLDLPYWQLTSTSANSFYTSTGGVTLPRFYMVIGSNYATGTLPNTRLGFIELNYKLTFKSPRNLA